MNETPELPHPLPVLETVRLRLEPLGRAHSAGMFALWSAPEVCEYAGDAEDVDGARIPLPAPTPAESERLLEYWLARAEAGTGCRWAVVEVASGEFLGAVGLNGIGRSAELAYHMRPECWGRGFAREACRAVVERAFFLGVEVIECHIEADNARSIGLAEALGFRRDEAGMADSIDRYALARGEGST